MDQSLENTKAQMRKGLLEYCILLTIAKDTMYVSDIIKELKAANLLVVEGTLYPLLSRLKSEGFLSYEWRESEAGPPRKYYQLTPLGQNSLNELTESWKSLSKSIATLMNNHLKS